VAQYTRARLKKLNHGVSTIIARKLFVNINYTPPQFGQSFRGASKTYEPIFGQPGVISLLAALRSFLLQGSGRYGSRICENVVLLYPPVNCSFGVEMLFHQWNPSWYLACPAQASDLLFACQAQNAHEVNDIVKGPFTKAIGYAVLAGNAK
jgi:hypothetical protein